MKEPLFHVDRWEAAEENAADWMRRWAWPDARTTGSGRDGGIDVVAGGALAQVKFKANQTSRPDVQNLVGAAYLHPGDPVLLFFTGTSFSASAIEYAELANVALFVYDLTGSVTAQTSMADGILRYAEERREQEDPKAQRRRKWLSDLEQSTQGDASRWERARLRLEELEEREVLLEAEAERIRQIRRRRREQEAEAEADAERIRRRRREQDAEAEADAERIRRRRREQEAQRKTQEDLAGRRAHEDEYRRRLREQIEREQGRVDGIPASRGDSTGVSATRGSDPAVVLSPSLFGPGFVGR